MEEDRRDDVMNDEEVPENVEETFPGDGTATGDFAPLDDETGPEESAFLDDEAIDSESEEPPRRTLMGEIVNRRSPLLIGIVFLFGIFLAVVPMLFFVEKSPYTHALLLVERLSTVRGDVGAVRTLLGPKGRVMTDANLVSALEKIPSVDRTERKSIFQPVEGRQYGPDRAYVLTFMPTGISYDESHDRSVETRFLFIIEKDVVKWEPWESMGFGPNGPNPKD